MTSVAEPLVSIIMPVYNVALYIDACLESIKQQTYKNIEIIVVEDCSTDNSKQAL
ncbi:glycosyltransferase family 2 protein, partial [Marinobacter sp. 1Y8]